jgi:ribosomal-protein-alanine N-acetyltransferase
VKTLEIIPATSEFLPDLVNLDQCCFGGLWTADGYQREITSPNSDLLILRAKKVGGRPSEVAGDQRTERVVGRSDYLPPLLGLACLWSILEEAHITLLAVHPHYQQQGLGQALLHALLQSAHKRDLERATLEVRSSNQVAIALYQRFGFQEAGRRRKYYPDTQEDALILWQGHLQDPEFLQKLDHWQHQIIKRLRRSDWTLSISPTV